MILLGMLLAALIAVRALKFEWWWYLIVIVVWLIGAVAITG
jgi:hypothetical protein